MEIVSPVIQPDSSDARKKIRSAISLASPGRPSGWVSRERVRQVELKTKTFLARYLSAFNQDEEHLFDDSGFSDAAA